MSVAKPLPIVRAGDPVLRAVAAPVPPSAIGLPDLADLVASMVATMRKAPGVGLAAPQIGVGQRTMVLEDADALMKVLSPEERALRGRVPFPLRVFHNPVLQVVGTERATFFEGCLSVPGYMALVERALEVELSALDESGAQVTWRVRGWPARILQHELDHLDGTLYVDRMIPRSFCANEEVQARWLKMSVAEVRAALKA